MKFYEITLELSGFKPTEYITQGKGCHRGKKKKESAFHCKMTYLKIKDPENISKSGKLSFSNQDFYYKRFGEGKTLMS